MDQLSSFIALFCTVVGAALWHERRVTKIETLLMNHLAHHESYEKAMEKIVESLLAKVVAK